MITFFEASSSTISGDFNKITVGKLFTFEIVLNDIIDGDPYVFLTGPTYLEGYIRYLDKGKYNCQFFPTRTGNYNLFILNGQNVVDCTPYPIVVKSDDKSNNIRSKRIREDEININNPLKRLKKRTYVL